MPNTANIKSDNPTLIEWISSIYGIYFGIWLGFFVEQFIKNQDKVTINIPFYSPSLVAAGFSLIIVMYTYFFVKWMWIIKDAAPNQRFSNVIRRFKSAPFLVLVTDAAILAIGILYKIDSIWTGMGVWASLGWVSLLAVIVLSDRRGWR